MKKLHLPGVAPLRAALRRPVLHRASLILLFSPAAAFAANLANQVPPPSSDGTAVNVLKLLFGLAIVLALMAASTWALKRFGVAKAGGNRFVKVVGGVNVGTRERVLVVEVADQWIVVGVAPGRIASLATMPRQEGAPPAEAVPVSGKFAGRLKQAMEQAMGKRDAN
jgi:flagellar protein FliO/FliZ